MNPTCACLLTYFWSLIANNSSCSVCDYLIFSSFLKLRSSLAYTSPLQHNTIHSPNLPFFFSSVQLLSSVRLFATPWTGARQDSLSITNSRSLLKFMSIKSVMPSNHLILCHPLLLLPSIFPNIRVFFNESVLCIRRPNASWLEFQLQHQSF